MSHGALCPVRPGNEDTGEGQDEDDHQDNAYRKAWAPFNPDQEEEETTGEGTNEEIEYEEGQRSRAAATPKAPTAREWEEHMVSHWPFRSWCEHCVRGKAKADHHKTVKRRSEIPIAGIDYMWMTSSEDKGEAGDQRGMPILVSVDEETGWVGAWVVPEKGEHWHAIKVLTGNLEEVGHKRVIVRSDQEPAILKLKQAVKREASLEMVNEESPVGESPSLGSVNIHISILQGQIRTLRDAVETKYRKRMHGGNPAIPWMVQHAAGILNRYRLGSDGKTAYQRVKGRKFQRDVVEFGECVWYLKPKSVGRNKAEMRWEEGVWLGVRDKSGEMYIGTDTGVIKVRSVRRKGTAQARWDIELWDKVKGTPW